MAAPPTGVVTFVLTDVVGATELWERAPHAMTSALARYDELVDGVVTAEGGSLMKSKGEGDSTLSAFGRPSDAMRAAYRLQRAIAIETWPIGATIRVRVGVHTGEAVERHGHFRGPAVNRAAGLRAVARGGEILVSAATATVVGAALPPGCELIKLAPVRLRGIEQLERAFALVAPDLAPISQQRRVPDRSLLAVPRTTRREGEVLVLVGENLTNAEVAARLNISERTVESHVSSLLRKLGANDRRELARRKATTEFTPTRDGPTLPALPAMLELLADGSTFVGRHAERQELRRQWKLARAGQTLFVVVTGEAGIGKSRLVSELAVDVHADGGHVLLGACYEDVGHPYDPFAQVISADASELTPDELDRRLDADREALTRLSPVLAKAVPADHRGARDDTELGRMLDAIEHWLVASASTRPLLLIVEDLHWSTSTTRETIRHLVRKVGRHPLLVVATSRDAAPDVGPDLSALLSDIERSPAVSRTRQQGLDLHDVAVLIGASTVDAESIVAETGGNPLLITHMPADRPDSSVAALLSRREELLDDDASRLLDLAATFGSEFDADLLAAGQRVPLMAVLESLERAEAAGLVVPLPGRRVRFRFLHGLFRSHRYQTLTLRRLLETHAAAASALATRDGDRALSERARHACLAVPVGDARTAVDLAEAAAQAAECAYAYDEASLHYRRGLDAARSLDPPDPRIVLGLRVRLAAALHQSGDRQGLPMLYDAAHRARADDDVAALVRVALSFSHFGASAATADPVPAQLAVIEHALSALGAEPSADRARLLIELAGQIGGVRVDESVELARQAMSIAHHVGDPDLLGTVLLGARHVGRHPSRMREAMSIGVELEVLGHQLPSLALTLAGVSVQTLTHLERGEVGRWRESQQRFARLLGNRTLPQFQLIVLINRASEAVLEGRFDTVENLSMSMAHVARSIGHSPQAAAGATMLFSHRLTARDGELLAPIESTVNGGGEVSLYQCALAAVQARVGAVTDARRTLGALRANGFPIPRGYGWTLAMAELAEASEVAADVETAEFVLVEIGPYPAHIATTGSGTNRPIDQALAQAALASGDTRLAEECAGRAVSASRQRNTPVFLCRELVFLAEAQRRAGTSVREVRPLVDEAQSLAKRLGVNAVLADLLRYGLADR